MKKRMLSPALTALLQLARTDPHRKRTQEEQGCGNRNEVRAECWPPLSPRVGPHGKERLGHLEGDRAGRGSAGDPALALLAALPLRQVWLALPSVCSGARVLPV